MSSIALASHLIDALVGVGITDVVLAPGSRSAALALAVDRADKAGQLRLHVRIDERVAAFTALGIAKGSGRAAAVITTSGTATANLGPAAMEATAAGVPLLLITADRPAHLIGTGANQTGDQAGILGPSALSVIRLSSESGGAAAWIAATQRAVIIAEGRRSRRPGAVQLNVEFEAPLVGQLPASAPAPLLVSSSGGYTSVQLDSRRSVVLVGDANASVGAEARAVAELSGAPLLAEPSSNARAGANAIPDYRLRLATLGRSIERVIVFGHPTLSRPVTALLSRDDVELVVVSSGATWIDPGHRVDVIADRVLLDEQDPDWLARWREPLPPPVDAQYDVAAAVLGALGPEDDLMLGASSIIRAADLAPIQQRGPRVFANRGLAGIDGTIATATGLALATGHPTTVLLGDLTAQHDLGALVRPPGEPWPESLRVVVVDDQGGSIFAGLEQGGPEYAGSFDRVFRTAQGVDLAAVAASLGWKSVRTTVDGVGAALHGDGQFIVVAL